MVHEARIAADALAKLGVNIEIVDPRSIRPLDEETILSSVHKTGHLLVADVSHELCGFASEVTALVAEHGFADLKSRPRRLTLPDCPTPVAKSLEDAFYPTATTIARLAYSMLHAKLPDDLAVAAAADDFRGPY
jgi:pyruvate dehydrogenase E1 component beta subunit